MLLRSSFLFFLLLLLGPPRCISNTTTTYYYVVDVVKILRDKSQTSFRSERSQFRLTD